MWDCKRLGTQLSHATCTLIQSSRDDGVSVYTGARQQMNSINFRGIKRQPLRHWEPLQPAPRTSLPEHYSQVCYFSINLRPLPGTDSIGCVVNLCSIRQQKCTVCAFCISCGSFYHNQIKLDPCIFFCILIWLIMCLWVWVAIYCSQYVGIVFNVILKNALCDNGNVPTC